MSNPIPRVRIATICAIVALIPIVTASFVAREHGFDVVRDRTMSVANELLARAEAASDQTKSATKLLETFPIKEACSEAGMSRMHEIALHSPLLFGIAHVEGDTIDCSSVGGSRRPFEIGPPDIITPLGAKNRLRVHFYSDTTDYMVVQRGHFAGIFNKDAIFSYLSVKCDFSAGIYSNSHRRFYMTFGKTDLNFIILRKYHHPEFLQIGRSLVAITQSDERNLGAAVVISVSELNHAVVNTLQVLLPIGILLGIGLSFFAYNVIKYSQSLPSAIRSGLVHDEFFVEYQPMVALDTGLWVGAEALVRWRRGNQIVRPDLFIPVAEEVHLIRQITQRVLQIIGDEASDLFRFYPDFHMAINISADDLKNPHFIHLLGNCIACCKARNNNFVVEVTERTFVDINNVRDVIERLRDLGISIAIDDFGTGYSSLAQLVSMPVDFIKIDKLFVQTADADSATSKVAAHIIKMSKALDLRVIAEGVETDGQARILRTQGVEFVQGWAFSKALPIDEFLGRLQHNHFLAQAQTVLEQSDTLAKHPVD